MMTTQLILIGDSIRMGYQETVERELAGVAEIWRPEVNGGNSANVLAHLDEWVLSRNPALVHLNCGLHDIKRAFDQDAHAVVLEEYEANLREIFTQITGAGIRMLWARTTPVNEQWHHENKEFDRAEQAVRDYNTVADRVATEFGLPIDDLYGAIMAAGRDALLLPDGVHFKPEGYALLGRTVAAFIRPHLTAGDRTAR